LPVRGPFLINVSTKTVLRRLADVLDMKSDRVAESARHDFQVRLVRVPVVTGRLVVLCAS